MTTLAELKESFQPFDDYRPELLGYAGAIDHALQVGPALWEEALSKCGEAPTVSGGQKLMRSLGALAQLWRDESLPFPQKPSTLGQTLVLGTLGALGGYGLGRLGNHLFPRSPIDLQRLGAVGGGLLGSVPGLAGGVLNAFAGKPALTDSFWDTPDLERKQAAASFNVQEFDNLIWSDPSMVSHLPPTLQAAASGLVRGAANLPGKVRNSPFVTPGDIARMAIGMGSGAAAGWVVGRTLGAVMGLSQQNRDLLTRTGALAGVIKEVIPMAYGGSGQ